MTDLLAGATVTSFTENGLASAPNNPSWVKDGNNSTASILAAGGAGGSTFPIRGWVADFGGLEWVHSFTIRETPFNNPTIRSVLGGTMAVGSYGSRLQYWNGSAWIDLPGSVTADDLGTAPRIWTFTATTPVQTSKVRIRFGGKQGNNIWGRIDFLEWNVTEGAPPAFPLVCDFSATPISGVDPLEVTFTDESTGSPDAWLWDFGDGETSTDQNPVHVYTEPGNYDVTLSASRGGDDPDSCSTTQIGVISVSDAQAWDLFDADALLGEPIATLSNAKGRWIRSELHGMGEGGLTINRHASEATEANFAEGNMVKARIPDCGPAYLDGFFLGPDGDYTLLSARGGQGKEDLVFRGPGPLSYIDRARMTQCAFSLESTVQTWTKVWQKSMSNPAGACLDPNDDDYLYVIGLDRRVRRIRRSDHVTVSTSPPLWSGSSHWAAGISRDPSDNTILWALEAPWLSGSSANTKIRKVRISDWAILDTLDLGSAIKHTDIEADASALWLSRYDGSNTVYKRSKTTGNNVGSSPFSITYKGTVQTKATGLSINGGEMAVWYSGTRRALIVDTSDPDTVTRTISTRTIASFGGGWFTIAGDDYFVMVSSSSDTVWLYQLTDQVPQCVDDSGVFHPEQQTPGALAWRVLIEITHPDRPQQPCPELTFDFTEDEDSNGTPWPARTSTEEFTWRVGDRAYTDVLSRLIPAGVTFDLDVNTMTLHAYVDSSFGTDRTSATFAADKVRFVEGVNLGVNGDLGRRDNRGQPETDIVVAGDGGVYGAASLAGRYVREGFLQVSGPTTSAVLDAIGDDELARQRLVADALGFETLWAVRRSEETFDDLVLLGRYVPKLHYWKGDLVTVDMEPGEFSYVEADLRLYGTLITERDGGWRAAVDLGASYKVPAPITSVPGNSTGSSSAGSGGGSSGGTTIITSIPLTVSDGEDINIPRVTKLIAEGVTSPEPGVAVIPSAPASGGGLLGDLDDVVVDGIADGEAIAWDASTETWVPVDLVTDHGALAGLGDDDHPQYTTYAEAAAIAATGLATHTGDAVDAHDASAISFTPAGSIAATDVQAAIEEVAAEATGGGGGGGGGGVIAIPYTFDTTTADADPGAGVMRLSNASQYLAVTARLDLTDADGADVTGILDDFADATGTVRGYLRIQHATDSTKWLVATVSAIASPTGYRNVTIANVSKSANSPFTNGDDVIVAFDFGTLAHGSSHKAGGADVITTPCSLGFELYGGSAVLPVGFQWDLGPIPWDVTVTEWTLTGDASGAAVVDVWMDTYGNYPPTVADTITGTDKPTITASGTKAQSSALTGWTTSLPAGRMLRANVDSVTSMKRLTLTLKGTRPL